MTASEVLLERDETGEQARLVRRAAGSVKWALLYNAVPRLVTPFSTLILAALLTPADLGLVAIAILVIALARILVDMGLGKAVIRRETDVEEAASTSLWVSLSVSAGLYGLLWAAAPAIAAVYKNSAVTDIIRVAALFLPLSALVSIPSAMLQRGMEFRRLFWVNSSFLIVQAVASVGLALAGLGYWAMIFGQLIGMSTSVALAWGLAGWRPARSLSGPVLRSMAGFGSWVMVSGFLNWLFLYADNAIAGLFLGVQGLGIYSLGFTVSILIPAFFMAAVGDVAYPTFCRLQASPEVVGDRLLRLQRLAAAVLFPAGVGMAAIAQPVVELLYGDKWQGLGMVIGFLALMPGLCAIWSLNEPAYQAVGRPGVWTKLSGLTLAVLLPSLWLAAPHGLWAFTLVRFAGAALVPLMNSVAAARVLGLGVRKQIRAFAAPFSIAGTLFILVYGATRLLSPFAGWLGWIKLAAIVAAGAAFYVLVLRQTSRGLWNQLFVSLRRMAYAHE